MIQLPLNTPSERSAAFLALHEYIRLLDGASPLDRPDVGAAPAPALPPVLPPVAAEAVAAAPVPPPVLPPVAAPAPAQVLPPAPAFEAFSAPLPAGAMLTPPADDAEDPPMPAFGTAAYAEKVLNGQHEVDIHGEVWDPAKHSSTKAKNADGSWRARRNRTAAAPAPALPPVPPVAAALVLPPVPPVAAAAAPVTVNSVIEYAVGLMTAAKAPGPVIADCFSRAGVPNGIAGLAGAPEKAAEVMTHLKALG